MKFYPFSELEVVAGDLDGRILTNKRRKTSGSSFSVRVMYSAKASLQDLIQKFKALYLKKKFELKFRDAWTIGIFATSGVSTTQVRSGVSILKLLEKKQSASGLKLSRFPTWRRKGLNWRSIGLKSEVCQDYKPFLKFLVHQDSTRRHKFNNFYIKLPNASRKH